MIEEIKKGSYKEKEIEELLNNAGLSFDNLKYIAREVANNTWSPYSLFPVGAVVVGIDQNKNIKTFSGTNMEPNVHLSVCAERVAIFNGIAAGFKKFISLAISTPKAFEKLKSDNKELELNYMTPCGACREVILQKLDSKAIILIDGIQRTFTPSELLPHPVFDINKLKSLTLEEMDALDEARKALHNAYVPYSKDKYGVSLLLEDSREIFSACTIDSDSFGCSVEPLKSVFGSCVAKIGIKNFKNKIKVVVFAFPLVKYPPGDALQLISDYAAPGTKVIVDNMGISTIDELLPWAFKL